MTGRSPRAVLLALVMVLSVVAPVTAAPGGGSGGADSVAAVEGASATGGSPVAARSGALAAGNVSQEEGDGDEPVGPTPQFENGTDGADDGDAPGGTYDIAEAPGAESFDREVGTYTMRGSFTPEEGLDGSVLEAETDRVHVLVQFRFDDPQVRKTDAGRGRNWEQEFDLSYCGSYMDDSGWENAHCFGIPTEQVEEFAEQDAVRSVTHIGPELKMYEEIEAAVEEGPIEGTPASEAGEEGRYLFVETYPDVNATADRLTERYGVEFTREDPRTFSTERVASMERVAEIADSERVAWIGWYRPTYATINRSREHVGVAELNGPGRTSGPTGEGTLVGVMDTGIQADHPHFDDITVTESADWVDWGTPVEDEDGHGTHVAGTITGNSTWDGNAMPGIAPDADLVVGRVMKGNGTPWAVVAGRWLPNGRFKRLDNDAPGTMTAISNSWGMDDTSRVTPLSRYDKMARSADRWAYRNRETLVVFSNGNACDVDPDRITDETGCSNHVSSPALGKNVLSVGATMPSGGTFDSSGLTVSGGEVSPLNDLNPPEDVVDLNNGRVKPEVLAPGEGIDAPVPTDDYGSKRGTSMAAPHVSGVAALLEERHPNWDANTKRAVLIGTTTPVRNPNDFLAGYGEVNARDALRENSYESDQEVFHGTASEGDRDVQATVRVPEDAHQLDATLTWMDPPRTAGGVNGFIFNRLDLVLIDPSGNKHRRGNPSNVKKIQIDDPEAGEWTVVVKGANVGPAFKPFGWFKADSNKQQYDGMVRVVEEEPRVGVDVEHANLSGRTRAEVIEPTTIELDPGNRTNVTVSPEGLGYVTSDVDVTVNLSGMRRVRPCDGNVRPNLDAGDLAEGQSESIEICLEARSYAGYGTRTFNVTINSTNGVDSEPGETKRVEIPFVVTESQPPDPVGNLRSTTHTPGEWTDETTFGFAWDRPNDPGDSGIDGYTHVLAVVESDEATDRTIRPRDSGRFWTDDPRSTTLTVEKEPTHECYIPGRARTGCVRFSSPRDVNATSTGASTRQELWLYVRATDNSSNTGDVERLGPFLVDLEDPGPFSLDLGKPDTGAGTGSGEFYERTPNSYFDYEIGNDSMTAVWEAPGDEPSGVEEYYWSAVTYDGKREGRVAASDTVVAPGDPSNDNRSITVRDLSPGTYSLNVAAIDKAGNVREKTLRICVQEELAEDNCITPGEKAARAERARETIREGYATQRINERIEDGEILGPRAPDTCPGTYYCGDRPRPWSQFVLDERVMIHVRGPGGNVADRYIVAVDGGEVTEFRRLEADATVEHTANVYTDIERFDRITDSNDPAGEVVDAYQRGQLEVTGEGPANQVRFAALKFGAQANDAALGALDFLASASEDDEEGVDTAGPIVDPGTGTDPIVVPEEPIDGTEVGTEPIGTEPVGPAPGDGF